MELLKIKGVLPSFKDIIGGSDLSFVTNQFQDTTNHYQDAQTQFLEAPNKFLDINMKP